ncbi:MAG: hypothetical protein CVU52_05875 [Deltaproteobacteria bacterium HGW-Deltaproteobacteria-10]|nr:MAG: hypothetical protein CVU52_05875 [Deltaproteobacteria bacterium HGW-Deltaproteobacteria-10]
MSLKVNADSIMDWYGHARTLMPFIIRRHMGYFFYITGRCNLNCDYCWQRETPESISENTKTGRNELSGDEWIKIIKSVPKLSFVGLTGGEPLIHPEFKKIIEYMGGRLPYTVNTNGVLLNEDILTKLIKYKATNLSISLDGFSDVHDLSRKRPGLFDHIVEAIGRLNTLKKKMHSAKPSLTIKTVLLDSLLERLDEFYGFCDKVLKADCLNISVMKTTAHAQYDFRTYEGLKEIRNIGTPECYKYSYSDKIPEALNNLLEISKRKKCKVLIYPRMHDKHSLELLFKADGKGIFDSCYIPMSLMVILADGSIIPCLSVKIANIRELDFDVRRINTLGKYNDFLRWRNAMNRTEQSPPECNMCCFSKVKKQ